MNYRWVEYDSQYDSIISEWLDDDAKIFTEIDISWDDYVAYRKENSDGQKGEFFWSKMIFDGEMPIAVIAISMYEEKYVISEFIVDSNKRGRGHGSGILSELLKKGIEILGDVILSATAVIYPNNVASQKAFEKAGFRFDSAHPDGDALYYRYDSEN